MIERIQLEANVVRHCTNRCSACSHAAPWAEHYVMPVDTLKRDLDLLSPFLHAQEFHIVGGEPLLHPELEQIVDAVNASPIATLTVVSTNGKLLPQMGEWFWQKIDVLRLSIYANLDPGIPVKAREQCEKNGVRYDEMGMGKFFKQFHPSLDGASFKDCPWKERCLTVHDGWLFRCPQSAFFGPLINPRLTISLDGFPLLGKELTEQRIVDFLDCPIPLVMCHFCRSYTDSMDWKEASSKEEWMKESTI